MTESERLAAIEAIRILKSKYWLGVDTVDGELVRSILHPDCVLDCMGCCTDPASGVDHMPQMNIVMRGRESWQTGNLEHPRLITVHHGHQHAIEVTSQTTANGVWAFTDRFFMPPGSPFSRLTGYGHYHDTYEKLDGEWLLKTMRFTRLWVETS